MQRQAKDYTLVVDYGQGESVRGLLWQGGDRGAQDAEYGAELGEQHIDERLGYARPERE